MSGTFDGLPPYEGYEDVKIEKRDEVVVLTMNVPEKLNALTPGIRFSLKRICEEVHDDDSAKVLVITGEGKGFCSGADVGGGARATPPPSRVRTMENSFAWITRFQTIDKPVIAAVNGVAAGGGLSLALGCDIRIASDQARFLTVFVRRALIPDVGVTWFLPRVVGLQKALTMSWLSDEVKAEEAERIGLVDKVVPHDQLMEATMELAARLAKGPSIAIELTKRAMYRGLISDLPAHLDLEEKYQAIAQASEDAEEGRRSFQEKRPPDFKGR